MKCLKKTVELLSQQGVLIYSLVMLAGIAASIVLSFIDPCETYILFAILFAGMVAWNISDAFKAEEMNNLRDDLANTKDKLCLAEHEADKLRIELDATQAALREKGSYNRHRDIPAEAPSEDKTDAPEAKGLLVEGSPAASAKKLKAKTYKRPAPRRKLNINVDNESKD